jgi:hypothetical protein
MPLKDHVAALEALIASTPFVTATSLSYEERPPSAGFITGTIRFIDDSQLDLKQFFIIQPGVQVIKYGYHYRMGIASSSGMITPAILPQNNFRRSLTTSMLLPDSLQLKNPPLSRYYKKSCHR